MAVVFEKTKGLTDKLFHYCPGCTHGIIHRFVAEVLEELDLLDRYNRGCSCWMCSFCI